MLYPFYFVPFGLFGDNVSEIWTGILQLYRDYTGTGMLAGVFIIAVGVLIYLEKEKDRRVLLVLMPILVFVMFLFPLFAWAVNKYAESEIYYRFLWLLPVTIVIAYVGTKILLFLRGWHRIVAAILLCCIITVCGDYAYDNEYFSKAENVYHVPQVVVDICDDIVIEGREVRAVFPAELVQYVRQYSPYVCLAFGRDVTVDRWNLYNEVYEIFELGLPNGITEAKLLADVCRNNEVHYVIWDSDREMIGDLADYGFTMISTEGKYDVYIDDKAGLR